MRSLHELLQALFTPGTPACALLGGVGGVVLAALLLTIGFWRTLFIALFCALGVFLGGVKDKGGFCKKVINRLFPPKA